MKILFITTLYYPHIAGGAEISIKTLAESLLANGHDVAVLATAHKTGLTFEMIDGVRVWRAGLKNIYWHHSKEDQSRTKRLIWHLLDIFNPFMTKYAESVIESERPDIIQIHVISGWTSAILQWASRQNVPTVQVLTGYDFLCPKATTFKNGLTCLKQCVGCRLTRIPHKIYSQRFAAVVGVSRFVLQKHISFDYFKEVPNQRVIYNARDPNKFGLTADLKLAYDAELAVSNTYPHGSSTSDNSLVRFGFIGSLKELKGLELLLETFMQLPALNAELWVAGTGAQGYVRSLQDSFKDARIKFLGATIASEFFRDIDVVVVPSLWDDPLPGVTFEALAFGCPVIGASRGGIPEMVQHDLNGYLFNPENPAELARSIRKLCEDAETRQRFSTNAPASVAKFFSLDRFAMDYIDLYESLIEPEAINAGTKTAKLPTI